MSRSKKIVIGIGGFLYVALMVSLFTLVTNSNLYSERYLELCQCYAKYQCNWSSWVASALGGDKVCNLCNSNFIRIYGEKHDI